MKVRESQIPAPLFMQIMDAMPICTVDIVLFDREASATLLFRRTNPPLKGEYYTCGGRLRKNEGLVDAAARILESELKLIVPSDAFFGGHVINEVWPESAFPGINYHTVNIYFGVMISREREISLDSQHDAMRWFPVGDLSLHENVAERIARLLQHRP